MGGGRVLAVAIGLVTAAAVALAASAGMYTGAITNADPSHVNFTNFAGGGPSACGPTPVYPGTITDSSSYHYDTYAETNSTGSPLCASITVQAAAAAGSFGVATYAYLGSFDPMNLATNYAGGANTQVTAGGSPVTYHVTVPAGQTLVVEVEEYVAGTGASYTLTIDLSPTAVQVASVSATRTSKGMVIRWRTGQEANLLGFRLERRAGGRTVRVGPPLIRASGGVTGRDYARLDRTAPTGRLVYRLHVVARDRTGSVLTVVAGS